MRQMRLQFSPCYVALPPDADSMLAALMQQAHLFPLFPVLYDQIPKLIPAPCVTIELLCRSVAIVLLVHIACRHSFNSTDMQVNI